MLDFTDAMKKYIQQSVLLSFVLIFAFPLNAQNTDAGKNLIGKRLEGLEEFPHVYGIKLKNDSILTVITSASYYGTCTLDLEYLVKNNTISLKLKLPKTKSKVNKEEEKLLKELGLLEQKINLDKFIKILITSPLVIIKDRNLETTYLSNGSLHYFEVDWLENQPTTMLMYSDARDYIEHTGTQEKIEKKFQKLLQRIRREEKKAGKKLYEIQRLSPNQALQNYNIVVRNELISVIFIENDEE